MIGIVLVSHSKALGEALADLVQQVSTEPIRIAVAAGAGEDYDEFGTDALQIMQAIEQVYDDDGVLLLMDLGSAILSAEMAVELLPPEMQEKIVFCPAPLIEGAIAAGVQAGLGSDLETACQEARGALLPHQRLGNALTTALVRLLYGRRLTDLPPLKAIRRPLLAELGMREMTYGWTVEMIVKSARRGHRIVEIPVSARARIGGQSKVSGTIRGTILAAYYLLRTTIKYAWRD